MTETSDTPGKRKNKANRPALSRDRIEQAALALIAEDGLEGFSIRKLGERLGCEAMSVYHHFPSKAHILDALVDRLVAGIVFPPVSLPPVDRLRALAHEWRRVAREHPRFFPFLSLHRLNSEAGVRFLNEVMGTLRDAGLPRATAARFLRVVNYYLVGAALDETAGYANGPSALNPVSDDIIAEKFPNIADAAAFFSPGEFDRTFEFGLNLLLGVSSLGLPPRQAE